MQLEEHDVIEPQISLYGEHIFCEYEFPITVYNIDKQEGYEYFWCDGSTADSLIIERPASYSMQSTHYLIGISPEGHSEISKILYVGFVWQTIPNVRLFNRNPACIGDTVKYGLLKSLSPIVEFEWSNGSKDTVAYFTEEGEVYITFKDKYGCVGKYIFDTIRFVSYPPTPKIERHKNFLVCEDSAFNYQWKINGEYTEITNNNFIEIKKAGVYQVIVRNENYCATISEPFLIEIPDNDNERIKAKIYPNPNSGIFNLELFSNDVEEVELKLYDNSGRLARTYSFSLDNYYFCEFDFSNYYSGAYYFELTSKNYKRIIPFVIK